MFAVRVRPLAAVLVVIAHMAIGATWYLAFEDPWLDALDKTAGEVEAGSAAIYLLPPLATLLNIWLVAWVLARSGRSGPRAGATAGVFGAATLIVPFSAVHNALSDTPASLTLIDTGVEVVALAMTGLVVGWLPARPAVAPPGRARRSVPLPHRATMS